MGDLVRVGDLEIDQDLAAQEHEWQATRIARVVAALVLLAGLAGLLGHGPLARAHAGESSSGLEADYSRFAQLVWLHQLLSRIEHISSSQRA